MNIFPYYYVEILTDPIYICTAGDFFDISAINDGDTFVLAFSSYNKESVKAETFYNKKRSAGTIPNSV